MSEYLSSRDFNALLPAERESKGGLSHSIQDTSLFQRQQLHIFDIYLIKFIAYRVWRECVCICIHLIRVCVCLCVISVHTDALISPLRNASYEFCNLIFF